MTLWLQVRSKYRDNSGGIQVVFEMDTDGSGRSRAGASLALLPPEIESEAIFNGHEAVVILHRGARFLLSARPGGQLRLVEGGQDEV